MVKATAILSLLVSIAWSPLSLGDESSASLNSAQSQMNIEDIKPYNPSDLNIRLVPEIGMSSMQYTGPGGGAPGQAISGGLTTEIGTSKARLLETGVLLLRSSSTAQVGPNGSNETVTTSQIAIPMMAKLRFIDTKSQAWYFKIGALTELQVQSDHSSETNAMDVMASAGFGCRVPVSQRIDLLIEATYNRGLISALETQTSVHEGILVISGLSIGL